MSVDIPVTVLMCILHLVDMPVDIPVSMPVYTLGLVDMPVDILVTVLISCGYVCGYFGDCAHIYTWSCGVSK